MAAEVLVGVSLSLSGPFGLHGEQAHTGLRLWQAHLARAGGLRLGRGDAGRPLRLVVLDDRSRAATARENVARFLTDERVACLVGPYSSGLTRAVLPLAETHGKVRWNHGGASDALFERGGADS